MTIFIDNINYISSTQASSIKNYNGVKHIRELCVNWVSEAIDENDEQNLIIDILSIQYNDLHILENWIGTFHFYWFINNIERRSDFTKNSVKKIIFPNVYYSY